MFVYIWVIFCEFYLCHRMPKSEFARNIKYSIYYFNNNICQLYQYHYTNIYYIGRYLTTLSIICCLKIFLVENWPYVEPNSSRIF